jgi:hypothetical protein
VKTILDDGYTWFLEFLGYRDDRLAMVVAEGLRTSGPEDIEVAGVVIRDTYALGVTEGSLRVEIRFERLVAWQCVDESWTTFDEYEQRDDFGKLQVLARSRYLDYVNASHGWYADTVGPAAHYRVWTEDEVVDVVAFDPPSLRIQSDQRPGEPGPIIH